MGAYLFVDKVNSATDEAPLISLQGPVVINELLGSFYICKSTLNKEMSSDDRQQVHEKQRCVVNVHYFGDII